MTSPRNSRKAHVAGVLSQGRVLRRPCRLGAVWTAGPQEAGRVCSRGTTGFFPGKDTSLGAQPVISQPIKNSWGEFPGGPVVRTVRCHCPGSR